MTDTLKLIPTDSETGLRLDSFLSQRIDTLSRTRAKALIKAGAITMDGQQMTDPRASAIARQIYEFTPPAARPAKPEPQDLPLDVLHEDTDLIIVNKAAGMTVHPAPGSWDGTLVNALLHHCGGQLPGIGGVERPGIVHRIDKLTSGVMVAAKTEAAHIGLSGMFAAHTIERAYLAVTSSAPRPLIGCVDAALARSPHDRKKIAVAEAENVKAARHAVTHYKALETYGRRDKASGLAAAALIECRLETGRTHQIRVHMAHIGASLIGDPLYGRHHGMKAYGHGEAFTAAQRVVRAFERQALHASVVGFDHPVSGERLRFEAPLPADMQQLINALKAI